MCHIVWILAISIHVHVYLGFPVHVCNIWMGNIGDIQRGMEMEWYVNWRNKACRIGEAREFDPFDNSPFHFRVCVCRLHKKLTSAARREDASQASANLYKEMYWKMFWINGIRESADFTHFSAGECEARHFSRKILLLGCVWIQSWNVAYF